MQSETDWIGRRTYTIQGKGVERGREIEGERVCVCMFERECVCLLCERRERGSRREECIRHQHV